MILGSVLRVLLVLATLATVARADGDKERAARLFEEARALVKQGQYDAACPVFDSSYQLDPAIGTELNLGDCYEHLNKLEFARKLYDAAAREHPTDKRAKFARERADAIARQIVDEKALAARAEQPPEPLPPPPPPAPVETHRRRSRMYVAVGLGVAGLGALVVAELYARSASSTYDDAFSSGECVRGPSGLAMCSPRGGDELDDSASKSTTSGVLAIAGAGLAVVGVVLVLTAPQDPISVAPVVGAREVGVSITARF